MTKKKKQKRKPRANEVRVDFGKDVVLSGMEEQDGKLIFYDDKGEKIDPKFIEVGDAYLRDNVDKGAKIISRSKADGTKIILDPNRNLDSYDYLFVIDTNSITINEEKISISIPIKFSVEFNGPTWSAKYDLFSAFEFRNAIVNPELIGWCDFIKNILKMEDFEKGARIAIVVDSELGRLSNINKRLEPILNDFYLPENFHLIYASADVGKENVLNKMIGICDSNGRRVLQLILESNDTISKHKLLDSGDSTYTKFCYWDPPKG